MVPSRLDAALARFDAVNGEDPRQDGGEPAELVYARRMTGWLERLAPEAPEELRLAARAQHIGRWRLPRERFPEGRAGYKRWRSACARMHADIAGAILDELGYDREAIAGLGDGEALLGTTSARLRRLGPGGVLDLADGQSVTVAAVVSDSAVGGAELAVDRSTGERLGVATDRYLLATHDGDRPAVEPRVRAAPPPPPAVGVPGPAQPGWVAQLGGRTGGA